MRLARPFCHHLDIELVLAQDLAIVLLTSVCNEQLVALAWARARTRSRVRTPSPSFFHISNLTGRCIPTGHLIFRELREEGKELEIEFDF